MGKAIVSGAGRASLGVLASSLEVGTVVKLMEDGAATEFIVVNQGNPDESLYDASCGGVWLLRKDVKENRQWNASNLLQYASSTINTWLNGDYFNSLGATEQNKITQVKIPYVQNGKVSSATVLSGSNGLDTKIFLVSAREIGYNSTSSGIADDGVKLSYFEATPNNSPKRIAYLNGIANPWWTRSPVIGVNSQNAWLVSTNGEVNGSWVQSQSNQGVRPALIIPSTSRFDRNTLLLKG